MNKIFIYDLVMTILWIILGIATIIIGPTRIAYACVLVVLVFKYICDLIEDRNLTDTTIK